MEESAQDSGLRDAMQANSALSEHDSAELKAYDLIYRSLADMLGPGERVLAYADRDLHSREADVLAYGATAAGPRAEVPDVMGYQPGGPLDETDALAYDEERGRSEPDVMGYEHGAPSSETDALAYDRPPETPENDAFMSGIEAGPADVDFLVLTDSQLVRGFLEHGKTMIITETPSEEMQVQVLAENYVAVRLPPKLCGLGEGDWWCWRAPAGVEPRTAAKGWTKDS